MKRPALLFALAFFPLAGMANAQAQTPSLDQLRRADDATIVPDRFLRSWDPVTLFFDHDVGPALGGPEDHPERLVTMSPPTAGAWQWLGGRALQFRPADPWKPLNAVEFEFGDARARLIPLLPTPESTSPSAQSGPVTDLDRIVLTFNRPVDLAALSRLTSIEVRPSPGVSGIGGQFLAPQDFSIRALERGKRDEKQSYVVQLKNALPDGRVAILRLRLSDEAGLDDLLYELRLSSAAPFTATEASCGRGLDRDTAGEVMRCSPYRSSGDDSAAQRAVKRSIVVGFSSRPRALDAPGARDALRISPPIDDLVVENDGSRLRLTAKFLSDTVYELRISPGALRDERNRPMEGATFAQRFAFAAQAPGLAWDAREGVVERFGPQLVPMVGAGYDKVDLRIHAVDPLSRDFWPFPGDGVETDDAAAPPLPGKEPAAWSDDGDANADAIRARIKALGSPAISELAQLPIRRGGTGAKFGLDLKPLLAKIAGADQPGTYLVGMRALHGGKREWMRIQVTDLTLSAVEETSRVRFAVTSWRAPSPWRRRKSVWTDCATTNS